MIASRRILAGLVILVAPGWGRTAAQSRAWLGLAFSCSHCEWQIRNGRDVFHFSESPLVESVDPAGPAARLGIRAGDVLVALDGQALTAEAGARRLAEAAPNDTLQVTFRRGNQTRTGPLVAAPRPTSELGRALAGTGRELSEALARIGRGPGPDSPLRFSGTVAGLGVEIRGSPDVTVVDQGECGMVILTPTARLTLTGPKRCASRSP